MKRTRKAITRLLAVVAVIAAFVAVYVIVMNGKDEIDKNKKNTPTKQANSGKNKPVKPAKKTPKTYVVKEGDTLGAIAAKTGVKVREILKLNEGTDAQSLSVGTELKLR